MSRTLTGSKITAIVIAVLILFLFSPSVLAEKNGFVHERDLRKERSINYAEKGIRFPTDWDEEYVWSSDNWKNSKWWPHIQPSADISAIFDCAPDWNKYQQQLEKKYQEVTFKDFKMRLVNAIDYFRSQYLEDIGKDNINNPSKWTSGIWPSFLRAISDYVFSESTQVGQALKAILQAKSGKKPEENPENKPSPNNPPEPSGKKQSPEERLKDILEREKQHSPQAQSLDDKFSYYHYAMVLRPKNFQHLYDIVVEPGDEGQHASGANDLLDPPQKTYLDFRDNKGINLFFDPADAGYKPGTEEFYAHYPTDNILVKVGEGGTGTARMQWWQVLSVGDLCVNWMRNYKDGDKFNVPCLNFFGWDTNYWLADKWIVANTVGEVTIRNLQFDIESVGTNKEPGKGGEEAESSAEIFIRATPSGSGTAILGRIATSGGIPGPGVRYIEDRLDEIDKCINAVLFTTQTGNPYRYSNSNTCEYDEHGEILAGKDHIWQLDKEHIKTFWSACEPYRTGWTHVEDDGKGGYIWRGPNSRIADLIQIRTWYKLVLDTKNAYGVAGLVNPANLLRKMLLAIAKPLIENSVKGVKNVISRGSYWVTKEITKSGDIAIHTSTNNRGETEITIADPDKTSAVMFLYDFVKKICLVLFIFVILTIGIQYLKESVSGGEAAKEAIPRFFMFGMLVFFAKYVVLLLLYFNNIIVKAFWHIELFSKGNILLSVPSVGVAEAIFICLVGLCLVLLCIILYGLYIYRTAAICALVVLSPAAMLSGVLESTRQYFKQWWSYLISTIFIQVFHTVVYCIFIAIWLSLVSQSVGVFGTGGWIDLIAKYLVCICALVLTITLPPKLMSSTMASGRILFGMATGMALRSAIGGVGKIFRGVTKPIRHPVQTFRGAKARATGAQARIGKFADRFTGRGVKPPGGGQPPGGGVPIGGPSTGGPSAGKPPTGGPSIPPATPEAAAFGAGLGTLAAEHAMGPSQEEWNHMSPSERQNGLWVAYEDGLGYHIPRTPEAERYIENRAGSKVPPTKTDPVFRVGKESRTSRKLGARVYSGLARVSSYAKRKKEDIATSMLGHTRMRLRTSEELAKLEMLYPGISKFYNENSAKMQTLVQERSNYRQQRNQTIIDSKDKLAARKQTADIAKAIKAKSKEIGKLRRQSIKEYGVDVFSRTPVGLGPEGDLMLL